MTAERGRAGRPVVSTDRGPSAGGENCPGVGDRLVEFLEDEMPAEARRQIEQHLAACPRCAREASDISTLLSRVRALPVPPASRDPLDGFAEEVRGRLAVERPPRRSAWQGLEVWASGWFSLRPIPAVSAAAVLGIMLAVGLMGTPRPPQPASIPDAPKAGELLPLAQNLDLLEQLDLLQDLDLLEQLPSLRIPENGRSLPVG
jgi:hypothetical protein